jgi:predicted YcjX-like family ATPase
VAISDITDELGRRLDGLVGAVTDPFADPVIRLGVTGLSRAGKTVFITGLVANLMDRARMVQLKGAARIEAAFLQPQPDMTLPRFDFETHLAALTGTDPVWPASTRSVSELRLSFRLRPSGVLAGLRGPRRLHLDIIDYPGEWLLDLTLLDRDYAGWSDEVLTRIARRPEAAAFVARARASDGGRRHDEAEARDLAAAFTGYLQAARAAGWTDCTPGRFLLPGDLAGSPVLTFAPLPRPAETARGSLWREMARRFDAYKAQVVKPFFRDHFARIDRQVVLVDALGAIHAGPAALEDLRRTMAEILSAFRPGRNGFLSQILLGRRVERILFAATKADHLHHSQHPRLTAIMQAMTREARDRAAFSGARVEAMSLAALRTTVEEDLVRDGVALPAVRGRLLATGRQAVMYPGELPEDPARLLSPARGGAGQWLDAEFALMAFQPARLTLRPGEGPPHIRLDRAAEFLIGDAL